ncbi:MAG: carboxypeptidase regulatory-like domain-containing protein [Acidobacteria bacterium]|nr:carboxypeptidase regulatory-like domain-containing protein [Acidobacteriota bacterium]
MNTLRNHSVRAGVLAAIMAAAAFSQTLYSLRGRVMDQQDAVIPGATVVLRGPGGETTAKSGDDGAYTVNGLRPGKYTVRVTLAGFAKFERPVDVNGNLTLDIPLIVELEKQAVDVSAEERGKVGVDPDQNSNALVLKAEDLDVLSDDPDQLAQDLQALAGPAAGPNGGQIFIDGFSGGQLPPKSAIREVRINSNPYSAEFDRQGFGRIEILTKPGADRFRGSANFGFNNQVFNSRNPFLTERAPFNSRLYGFNFGGPLSKKSSFSIDADRREIDDNSVINATILDSSLTPTRLQQAIDTPQRRTHITPRLDYALGANHTLVGRYSYNTMTSSNDGIGQFSLGSRAYDSTSRDHTVQLTETSILSPNLVNETRFQYTHDRIANNGDNTVPTVQVLDAFTGGGAQIGKAYNTVSGIELNNISTRTYKQHTFKFGGRVRWNSLNDYSPNNFGGSFVFTGGLAPALDAAYNPIAGSDTIVTSLEKYRRTLLLSGLGYSMADIRVRGGGASQFSIAGGNPLASVDQTDLGVFFLDDWRVKPSLTISAGLRYENQTNISSNMNFAPRLSLAWAIGAKGRQAAKTVVRAGVGVFYDRFQNSLTLQALRFNGSTQQSYIVQNPNFFQTIPSLETLASNLVAQTVRQVSGQLSTPYLAQTSIGIERQLPRNISVNVNYINTRGVHMLRTRNINAPILGSGARPYGNVGNIMQFESSGLLRQNQVMFGANVRPSARFTFGGNFMMQDAKSDTDNVGTSPAYTYDMSTEYGSSTFNTKRRFMMFGNANLWRGINASPFIMYASGRPFNITTGRDTNGDTIFNERPSFAAAGAPGAIVTPFGIFNPNPGPNDVLIPRNYGVGPSQFSVNMRVSRTWGFGKRGETADNGMNGRMGGPGGPGGMMGGGMMGGGGGMRGGGGGMRGGGPGGFGGGGNSGKRYSLTLSVSARNLLNTVNLSTPVGNLSSALFGQSTSTAGGGFGGGGPMGGDGSGAGNRRIDIQLRFSF